MKLSRAGVIAAGVIAGVVALTACGSSGNSSSNTTAAAGGDGSTSAGGSSSAAAVSCATGSLKGEGSTAQKNVMGDWIQKYQAKCSGSTIAYNATGSGAGVQQFNGGQVDFGGSDAALSSSKGEVAAANKRCGGTAFNLPMVTIPIGVAFNVKGVTDLTLTPDVVAKIFQGTITSWNDPAITGLNSGANLPATKITVFFRSDASGTTQNFENYLAASAPTVYTATPSKNWSGKVGQGKKGNDGVQQGVKSVDGGVGYLEWSFVVSGGLNSAKINNGGGAVEMNADTAGKAVSAATVDAQRCPDHAEVELRHEGRRCVPDHRGHVRADLREVLRREDRCAGQVVLHVHLDRGAERAGRSGLRAAAGGHRHPGSGTRRQDQLTRQRCL